jgi:hypothetical protein
MTTESLDNKKLWLQRRDDMLVLQFTFTNLTRVDAPDGTSTLKPTDPTKPAQLTIHFPPQAVLEQTYQVAGPAHPGDLPPPPGSVQSPPGPSEVSAAQFSNPSQLALTLKPGAQPIQLTAAGLLAWAGLVSDAADSALECVWGLAFQPATGSVSTGPRDIWLHNSQPETSPEGVIGLWHTSLMWGDSGGAPDFNATDPIPMTARTTGIVQHAEYPSSLGSGPQDVTDNLGLIAASATPTNPIYAREFTLSPLGATIDLAGDWPSNSTLVAYRHRAVLGRDEHVLILQRGYLLPFGFPVELAEATQRLGETVDGDFGAAVLSTASTIVVLDPLMVYTGMPGLPAEGRQFPFRSVRVHERIAAVLQVAVHDVSSPDPNATIPDVKAINVPGSDGSTGRYQFHLTAEDYGGNTIDFTAACYFIPLKDARDASQSVVAAGLQAYDGEQSGQPQPAAGRIGLAIDSPGDTMADLTAIYVGAVQPAGDVAQLIAQQHLAVFPRLAGVDAHVPAIDALSPSPNNHAVHTTDTTVEPQLIWAQSYLDHGLDVLGVYLQLNQPVAFLPSATGGGGLASINTPVVGLSQTTGLVGGPGKGQLPTPQSGFDPTTYFPTAMTALTNYKPPTLLGFIDLAKIVGHANFGDGNRVPQITTQLLYGDGSTTAPTATSPPTAVRTSVVWQPLVNAGTSDEGLVTTELTGLDINTTTTISLTGGGPPVTDIRGVLSSFTLSLVDGLVTVAFDSLAFASHAGAAPKLDVKISKVAPGKNAVAFFQRLLDNLPGAGDIPHIDYRDSSLIASYSLAIPSIPMGAFLMQNLAIAASVTLPLDGRPVQAGFSFASREHPFLVTVSLFGGGGFLALEVEGDKLHQLEAQLDFGAAASLDLIVASASVSVTAGIHIVVTDGAPDIDGFFRANGQVDLLGIISISLEIYLALGYHDGPPKVFEGTAEFTVRVSVAFFSQSLSFSVSRSFSAGSDPTFDIAFPSAQPWQQRCAAFASMVGS